MTGALRVALLGGAVAVVAAASPSFDPDFEWAPDPGFDDAGIGTITGTGLSIASSKLVASSTSSGANIVYSPTDTLVPGTYLLMLDTATVVNNTNVGVAIGGTAGSVATNPAGVHSVSIIVASVTSQTIKIGNFFSGKSGSWNSISVKRTA